MLEEVLDIYDYVREVFINCAEYSSDIADNVSAYYIIYLR